MSFPADVPPADDQTQRALSTQQPRPTSTSEAKRAAAQLAAAAATVTAATRASGESVRPSPATAAGQQQTANHNQKQRPRQESEANADSGRVTREYKHRMPKQRATAWPPSILSDPDVLSLDDEGRFVLCKVCHVHYAVHGGKKPKPVIMNSIFRTRAWEVHKERTNSHRMQKRAAESAARAEVAAAASTRPHPDHQQPQQHNPRHPQHPETAARYGLAVTAAQRGQLPNSSSLQDLTSLRHAPPQDPHDAEPRPQTPLAHHLPSLQRRRSDGMSTPPPPTRAPMLANEMSEQDLRRRVSGNERLFIRPAGTVAQLSGSNNPTPVQNDMHGDGHISQAGWTSGSKTSSRDSQPHDQGQSRGVCREQPPSERLQQQSVSRQAHEAEHATDSVAPSRSERMSRKRKSWERDEATDSSKEEEMRGSPGRSARDQYWRTLREVYTTSRTKRGTSDAAVKEKKKKKKKRMTEAKTANREGMADTPHRTVIVHDPTLINAIDRLAGVLSKQLSEMRTNESSSTRYLMTSLTTEVSEMRRRQEDAMERMLDLGERHLKVMEGILQCKLRKEQRLNESASSRRRDAPSSTQQQQPCNHQQQQQQRDP